MPDMRQVSTSKGSQHPTKPNETYVGRIRNVNSNGTVDVTVPKLNIVISNCKIMSGVFAPEKNDKVICGFLDGQQREMAVFGTYGHNGGIDSSIILASQIFS